LALLSRLFSLAIQWGHLERNRANGVKKYKETGPRERNLSGDELTRFKQRVYAHLLQGTLRTASEVVAQTLEAAKGCIAIPAINDQGMQAGNTPAVS